MGPPALYPHEICHLYDLTKKNKHIFAFVLSPRARGLKCLCVSLTKDGLRNIDDMYEFENIGGDDLPQIICEEYHIGPLYCQVPFKVDELHCHVADLREEDSVIRQLRRFVQETLVKSPQKLKDWI